MKIYKDVFNKIVDLEHLFLAWTEFKRGKGSRADVMEFEMNLEPNLFELHRDIEKMTYKHGQYFGFFITDPKRRHVHKATVRDRVLHHAVFTILNHIFEPTFIACSFSCRVGKGSHKGIDAVQTMLRRESWNNSRVCYALKCDIKKFFDTIDHDILLSFIARKIKDIKMMRLTKELVESCKNETEFKRERESKTPQTFRKGIPIGNLTSQLFANIYMNEFDQFMKHVLKVKHYARYTDDFIVVSSNREYLYELLPLIKDFLKKLLRLELHPNKMTLRKYSQGIDFLGDIILPHCRLIRNRTRK